MTDRQAQITLLTSLVERPLRTPPLDLQELPVSLQELARTGHLDDLKRRLMLADGSGPLIESCQVMKDGHYRRGLRLVDRDDAALLLARLRAGLAREGRRGRLSPLAV